MATQESQKSQITQAPLQKHKYVVVLLHYPVTNRAGEPVTTAVTNMDVHDISRTCRTYEVDDYFLVNPIPEQAEIVDSILGYWKSEKAQARHADRFEALSRTHYVKTFEAVRDAISKRYPGLSVEVAMPDARPLPEQETYAETSSRWNAEGKASVKVIVLGTGGGISSVFYPEVDTYLAPIYGPLGKEGYNHLSVRAAAAIILDRLLGK